MAYRSKYLTTKLSEADWENVKDLANLWGDTLSTAAMRIIQRGVEEIEKEMGSATPTRVKIRRLHESLKQRETLQQELQDVLNMVRKRKGAEQEELIQEIKELAEQASIDLT